MYFRSLLLAGLALFTSTNADANGTVEIDLLIVGGTESGVAAAVQAARMGVGEILLVSDTDWLGGQFSSEALAAIDENRGPQGYDQTVPFPRSGLFKGVIDRIEARNKEHYGEPRPGNTRVITTARPSDSAVVFAGLVGEYADQITVLRNRYPVAVEVENDRLKSVTFAAVGDEEDFVRVEARMVIDASDWGDVIKLSGAA